MHDLFLFGFIGVTLYILTPESYWEGDKILRLR